MKKPGNAGPMWHVTLYALAGMAAPTGHWAIAAAAAAGGAACHIRRRKAAGDKDGTIGGEEHARHSTDP